MRDVSDLAALPSAVTGATAVLVRSPGLHEDRDAVCATLSTGGTPDGAIAITYRGSPAEWLERVHGYRGTPAAVHVIGVGDTYAGSESSVGATVDRVESPENLTALEIAVTKALDTFGEDDRVTVCFDSVTAFLQYVEVEEAYRYLHALIERLWSAGAVGHFHVDPEAHEAGTLNSLTGLFDAVVDLEAGEGVGVRTSSGVGPDPTAGPGSDPDGPPGNGTDPM